MQRDWIIIADEATGQLIWFGKTSLYPVHLPSGRIWDDIDEKGIDEISSSIEEPRKRVLIIQKKRYLVVSRGPYYEP